MFVLVFYSPVAPRAALLGYLQSGEAQPELGLEPRWVPRPLKQPARPPLGQYYWPSPETGSSAVSPGTDTPGPTWKRPITYQPIPLVVFFPGILGADVPAPTDTVSVWRARFIAQMRPPLQTRFLYQEALRTNDNAPGAANFTFPWVARFLRTAKPPAGIQQYFQRTTEHDASAPAAVQDATAQPWRPQWVQPTKLPAATFQVIQQQDDTGQNATAEGDQPFSWRPPITYQRQGVQIRFGYALDEQPVQDAAAPTWQKPITYTPQDVIVRFPGIVGGDVPTPPTPAADTNATWAPRPLSIPKVPPSWRYIWNQPNDNIDEPGSQFQVFWQYQTAYERTARQFMARYLQSKSVDGVSIAEASTFPGYVPKPLRIEQLPKIARYLFQRGAQDTSAAATPEASTFPGYVPKPLWPFMAPRGAYMYYRSGLGKDVPPPLPTPTQHGHNSILYMRRLELLGIRLGMTAV